MNKRYIDFVPKANTSARGKRARVEGGFDRAEKADGVFDRGDKGEISSAVKARGRAANMRGGATGVRDNASSALDGASNARDEVSELEISEMFAPREVAKEPKFGEIEDFQSKFVNTEVKKRPLSRGLGKSGAGDGATSRGGSDGAAAAKAKKLVNKVPLLGVRKMSGGKSGEETGIVKNRARKNSGEETGILKSKARKSNSVDADAILESAVKDAEIEEKKMKIPRNPFVNTAKIPKRPLSKNVYAPKKKVVAPAEEPQGPVTIIAKPEKNSKMGLIVTVILTIILGAAAGTVAFLLLPK